MLQYTETVCVNTSGQQLVNVTSQITAVVERSKIRDGLLNMTILHTSASLLIQENASNDVLLDLIDFYNETVPVKKNYRHRFEGNDDMPAHIKSSLTNSNLSLSIINKNLVLGSWQGIFLFEHRVLAHKRTILTHLIGEK